MRLREKLVTGRTSTEFRRLLNDSDLPLVGICGGTAHHAQLGEATGFKYFGLSGSQASAHLMGMPDAGLMTLSEVTDNARRICQAVSVPVYADGETGFGNVVNATRTAADLINAGVAGFFMEDQVFPKRCGFTEGVEVIPTAEAAAKFKAVMAVRDELDPDVVFTARTDIRAAGGSVDDVLRRCEAYLDIGVDMLLVTKLQSREEIRRVRETFPEARLELNVGTMNPPLTSDDFKELGVTMVSMTISKIAQIWMFEFLRDFRVRGFDAYNEFLEEHKESSFGIFSFLDLTGYPKVQAIEQDFAKELAVLRERIAAE
ncbi:isocitrate lyase/PEP mutase family protein [Cereibacter sp. SYSU M97828]|nr:isocitrate lyase/PEP mutase family protein [Cereibacter flavus]